MAWLAKFGNNLPRKLKRESWCDLLGILEKAERKAAGSSSDCSSIASLLPTTTTTTTTTTCDSFNVLNYKNYTPADVAACKSLPKVGWHVRAKYDEQWFTGKVVKVCPETFVAMVDYSKSEGAWEEDLLDQEEGIFEVREKEFFEVEKRIT